MQILNRDFNNLFNCLKPIFVVTHPRSGTHLTIDFLRKQFRECQSWLWWGETIHHSYLTLDHLSPQSSPHIQPTKALEILSRCSRPIIKTHCLPDFSYIGEKNQDFAKTLISNADIYYVVRDGRDVLSSVHLWQQCSNPNARCSLSEFLRQEEDELNRPQIWANHVLKWSNYPNIKMIKFEEIVKEPMVILEKFSQQLGLNPLHNQPLLPKRRKSSSRWEDYWLRITRQWESSTIDGRYQGKKPQKWHQSWSKEDIFFFEKQAGDALRKLNYPIVFNSN